MPTLQSISNKNTPYQLQTAEDKQNPFKGFSAEQQQIQQHKQTNQSYPSITNLLYPKPSSHSYGIETISQKNSDTEKQSVDPKSPKSINWQQQHRDPQSKQSVEDSLSIKDNFSPTPGSKIKSKFAKLNSPFTVEEPNIIITSYKSFCSPSKTSHDINLKNNKVSNFLIPENNLQINKNQVTSAEKLIEKYENQESCGRITYRIGLGSKSSSRIKPKQTTFAALPQKSSEQQQNSNGVSLYEEVLAKNFEVIDNLLRKLNNIYSNQQEYEKSLIEVSQKLHKIEADNENIHHEFRTSHFMIDKKLNSMTNEYSNMLHEMKLMKKMFKECRGRGSFFVGLQGKVDQDNQSNLNSKRRTTKRKHSKRCSVSRKSYRASNHSVQRKQSFSNSPRNSNSNQRRSTRNSKNVNQKVSNWTNLKGVDEQNLGKILLKQIDQSGSGQGSQSDGSQHHFDSQKFYQNSSHSSQQSIEYDYTNYRSKNHSGQQRRSKKTQRISIENFGKQEINVIKTYISNQVTKMSSSSQINKVTLRGFESTFNKKFETFEQKIDEKFFEFKRDIIEERIQKMLRASIINLMEEKTMKMIEKDIFALQEKTIEKINTLEKKINLRMQKKCDKQQVRQDLKQILESMNRKVNTLMDECYHKFAQRNQSKRAILFLQKKINRLIQGSHRMKNIQIPTQTTDNTKCLSCSKNVPLSGNHHYTQSQPMLTQVHCKSPQSKEQNSYGNDYLETSRKKLISNQTHKRNVKFMEYSNLNYNSVSQIFNKTVQADSESSKGQTPLVAIHEKPMADTASSSKQIFIKKLKNTQTAESMQFGSINSNLKAKILLTANESRPMTSMNGSVHELKNWKSKATSILKKEGADWRSKSHYKKVA